MTQSSLTRLMIRVQIGSLVTFILAAAVALAPAQEETLCALAREILDWRLADALSREIRGDGAAGTAVPCKVVHNTRGAFIKLPDRDRPPSFPRPDEPGELLVALEDGELWVFRFAKIAVNVAWPYGSPDGKNQLTALLRRWFGATAGEPQAEQRVLFEHTPLGWSARPERRMLEPGALPESHPQEICAYPTLRVLAGLASHTDEGEPAPSSIELDLPFAVTPDHFAVRAEGDSMDGGRRPIKNGDWMVMRRLDGVKLGAVRERVALVLTRDGDGYRCQVKRVRKTSEGWSLCSDNLEVPPIPASEETTTPIAVLVG